MRKKLLLALLLLLGGCATAPPRQLNDSCGIFDERFDWYQVTKAVYEEHGVPIQLQLAFMHQESRFLSDAQPPREWLMGIIPWFRPSSAYGYAQVKDETWDWYLDKSGRYGADRDEFEDAAFFIGWYVEQSHRRLGISKWDVYNQYLAYHEGMGGWQRKTYRSKPWLVKVARKVERRARDYSAQLARCRSDLDSRWDLWPFW